LKLPTGSDVRVKKKKEILNRWEIKMQKLSMEVWICSGTTHSEFNVKISKIYIQIVGLLKLIKMEGEGKDSKERRWKLCKSCHF